MTTRAGLSDQEKEILAFERKWFMFRGAKEQMIRDTFDMSAVQFYQVLNRLLDREEALAFDPLVVKRLRNLRDTRQHSRLARRQA